MEAHICSFDRPVLPRFVTGSCVCSRNGVLPLRLAPAGWQPPLRLAPAGWQPPNGQAAEWAGSGARPAAKKLPLGPPQEQPHGHKRNIRLLPVRPRTTPRDADPLAPPPRPPDPPQRPAVHEHTTAADAVVALRAERRAWRRPPDQNAICMRRGAGARVSAHLRPALQQHASSQQRRSQRRWQRRQGWRHQQQGAAACQARAAVQVLQARPHQSPPAVPGLFSRARVAQHLPASVRACCPGRVEGKKGTRFCLQSHGDQPCPPPPPRARLLAAGCAPAPWSSRCPRGTTCGATCAATATAPSSTIKTPRWSWAAS